MADQLTAGDIKRLALANLAQRAAEGGKLSDTEWARLEAFEASDRPDPIADAAADLAQHLATIKAKGTRPPAAVVRLVRDLALREATHLWPDVAAAAKSLGVSVQTVRNWCDELGVEHNRTAIPMAELYRGLWLRERDAATRAEGSQTKADAEEQELRIMERQARVDERTGRLVAEANDAARASIIRAVRELREIQAARLPGRLADELCRDDDRLAWEGKARRVILAALANYCQELTENHTKEDTE